ncbi:MAG: pitrilysin family protein [Alphaproteobacteria bacterium]
MSVKISRLSNGLTVAVDTMPEAQSVALGVWVGVGTRHEPVTAQGVAHLVEHMLFKGTGQRSAIEISEAIEGVGGYMNAYTAREETSYHVRVLPEHAGLAVDILADMLLGSVIDPVELDRERTVIIQEIGQAYDTPDDYIFDLAQEVSFPDQGLGWSILGNAENIAAMPRQNLVDYLGRFYVASNMVLAASGKITHDELVRLAEKHFAAVPAGRAPERVQAAYRGGARFEKRDLEQEHLLIGFSAPSFHDPDYYAGQTLMMVLGGGSASRLFKEVREKRGLAYHVSAQGQTFVDSGTLMLYAGTSHEKVAELRDVIWQEIGKLQQEVTATECARAKAQLRAGLAMGHESPQTRLDHLTTQLLVWGREVPMAERLAQLETVTPDALCRLAQKLTPQTATTVGLGERI